MFLLHWICLGLPARLLGRGASYALERGLLVALYLGQYTRKGRRASPGRCGPWRERTRRACS